jgi:hypothetical protein
MMQTPLQLPVWVYTQTRRGHKPFYNQPQEEINDG